MTADQTHRVLRPLQQATTADAIAPVLSFLKDPFAMALKRVEEEANETLDSILSEGAKPMIKKIDLALHNRELATAADVDALLAEIRERLLAQINAGLRIRLQ